jgi:predicted RNA binding protein YcfA (HicA-like mRNA interferase family)
MSRKWRLPLGKLRVFSGKEVCAIEARYGFVEVRRRESHIVMQKKTPQGAVTVPVPDHGELRIGTLQAIIRQSGAPRSEFES